MVINIISIKLWVRRPLLPIDYASEKGPKSTTDLYSVQLVSSKIGLWAWKRVIVMFWHLIIWEVISRQWIQCLYVRHHAMRTIDIGALPILSQVEQENEMVTLEALHFPTWWTTFYTK